MADTLTSEGQLTWASFPIEKVEDTSDGNVMVWGKATDGSVDSDEQIVDPEFAAKALAEWMDSGPNVRVQHQSQRDPAGVGLKVEKDGDAHWVKSLIVEPVAQRLVKSGALRAYSVGIARPTIQRDVRARGGRITDGMIVELSLVDRPANKACGIQLVKSDSGAVITKVFGADDSITREEVTVTLPADVQMSFSPLDLAKIVNRRTEPRPLPSYIGKAAQPEVTEDGFDGIAKAEAAAWIVACREQDLDITKGHREFSAESRREHASEGNALPDGSYPIPDKDALRRAAILARSKHGDYRAASRLISRRARELGVPNPMKEKKAAKKAAARVANEALPDMTKPKFTGTLPESTSKCDEEMEEEKGMGVAGSPMHGGIAPSSKGGGTAGTPMHGGSAASTTMSAKEKKIKVACASCGAMQNNKHMYCSECGKGMSGSIPVEKNHDFMCLKCGYKLDKGEKHCPQCGAENPDHNPMADLKIPANKSEGSRVADEPEAVETVIKKAKPGKKGKGKPFGGNQAPPFGKDKDGDGDGDDKKADKASDAPVTRPKMAKKSKKAKKSGIGSEDPGHGVAGAAAADIDTVPAHREPDGDVVESFERDAGLSKSMQCAMRMKSVGISPEDGFLHDLACPAYSYADVMDAHPDGMKSLNADVWQAKALEMAASAPLSEAKFASQLGQHVFTLKSATSQDVQDVKNDLYKAFRDANPGPGSFPTPCEISAGSYQRPKITSGRAAYSHQYSGPNDAKVPDHSPAASQFERTYIDSGRANESPANKDEGSGMMPYPKETGKPVNLDYSSVQKGNVLDALRAMHDHFDRVMPSAVCPLNGPTTTPPAHSLVPPQAHKSDDQPALTKEVTSDGMSKNARRKLRKKLTKKVMSGKMPLDQARIRMGKKPKKSPEPLKPLKKGAAEPSVTKAATFDTAALNKAVSVALRKAEQKNSINKRIKALTKTVNALADQPDPATQPFRGMAANPIHKSASPAGVQEVLGVAERTQMMVLRELEDTARNSPDSAQREAAWNQVLKLKGLIPS